MEQLSYNNLVIYLIKINICFLDLFTNSMCYNSSIKNLNPTQESWGRNPVLEV